MTGDSHATVLVDLSERLFGCSIASDAIFDSMIKYVVELAATTVPEIAEFWLRDHEVF